MMLAACELRNSRQVGPARRGAGCSREERPVSNPEFRPGDLPAQDRELVPQHEQFNVFHIQAATATNKRTQQSPNGEVEEGEGHTTDPPNPLAPTARHRYWRPSAS